MKLNKKAMAGVGLAAVALVGGTFAYYTATNSLDNPLSTGKYSTSLVEDFTPPTEDLKPGQRWDKIVGAENTGDYPVLVRVKMEEKWTRKEESRPYVTISSDKDRFDNGHWDANTGIFDAYQESDTDGKTPEEGTVVYKDILAGVNGNKWVDGGDGYWYWNGVLEKKGSEKSSTDALMNKLVMATDIDLGEYKTDEYYAVAVTQPAADAVATDGKSVWTKIDWSKVGDVNTDGATDIRDLAAGLTIPNGQKLFRKSESAITGNKGYSDSDYTLTITSEFVQATKDAVVNTWGEGKLEKMNAVKVADDKVNLIN